MAKVHRDKDDRTDNGVSLDRAQRHLIKAARTVILVYPVTLLMLCASLDRLQGYARVGLRISFAIFACTSMSLIAASVGHSIALSSSRFWTAVLRNAV
jgi:hypothetical protein